MRYFTNLELAKKFGLSSNTIGYWIEDAVAGKNELQTSEVKMKTVDRTIHKIISNEHNLRELNRLYEKGRKSQNMVHLNRISINLDDINVFSEETVSEILNAIEEGYIPLKFTYMNGGAKEWNEFVIEGYKSNLYPTTKRTEVLLGAMYKNLRLINPEKKKINIIDVGCGNFLPVSKFVSNLEMDGLLNKYIGVDISPEMLEITRENALKHIPEDKIITETRDFESSNLIYLSNLHRQENVFNVFLFLGGTIGNYTDNSIVLKHMRDSMASNDLLFISFRKDTGNTYGIFNSISEKNERIFWIPRLFGFNPEDLVLTTWFSDDSKVKCLGVELKKDTILEYTFKNGIKKTIRINGSQRIMLASYRIYSIDEIINKQSQLGLELNHYLSTDTGETGLIVSSKKSMRERL
jgi:SAM-dependent methyltransferase